MNFTPVNATQAPLAPPASNAEEINKAKGNFADMFDSTIKEVSAAQANGDLAVEKLHTGEAKNLHDVMIAVEKADISLRMMVTMRNKALEAYKEISKMSI